MPSISVSVSPQERVVPFTAGDGFECNLIHVRGKQEPVKGPVLLVHGAGVSASIFRPPTKRTLVDALVDDGYDVWIENWRASTALPPNKWTLDQAAIFDHPYAVRRVIEETGHEHIKAFVHCQGSTSFMMGAVAGLMPQVTTIVSNAVSLHPIIPRLAAMKVRCVGAFSYFTDYMNPQWGLKAPTVPAKIIDALVRLTHHECSNAVCKHVSFTYGAGFPSLWSHENIGEEVHEWVKSEFGACPMTFFQQMRRSVRAGRILAVEGRKELPPDVLTRRPETDARIVFVSGADNQCFLPESQVRSFEYFDRLRPNYHSLHLFPKYRHIDPIIGKDASRDIFPTLLHELDRDV
jgi:pimeloyl-ACP methyl ester carboxylesterase